MTDDPSAGWDAVAATFAAVRSDIGAEVVRRWSENLPPGGTVVDIGCGTGLPIARALADGGFVVHGLDPSPAMLAAFRRNVPGAPAACETAEAGRYFDRRFDGAVAIGVLFLLPEDAQHAVIARVGRVLRPGGHFLFTAARRPGAWDDLLTGRASRSLGEDAYRRSLAGAGLRLVGRDVDQGSNHYLHAVAARA